MNYTQKIENIVQKLKTRKSKNVIYICVAFAVVFAFSYRFYAVAKENNLSVFNILRNNFDNGTPVRVVKMEKLNGILYEPLTVKNNRAYISGARVNVFKSGQKSGACKIVSVSKNIDLDTGMHIVKTSNCGDGLQYIEKENVGFYVPVSAVKGNTVFVIDDGVAKSREIEIADRDAQNVLIKSGVQVDDIVILSNVKDNEKVKIID